MATATEALLSSSANGQIRPFDVRRDMGAVADLVELCFSDSLDPDGQRYLQNMRSAASSTSFKNWASMAAEWASVPLTGYVWEQDGHLVGNVSLIPFFHKARRYYLIANVAVHPEYRRRGLGRNLTLQAMAHARQRGAPAAWLHVRDNNETAVNLYRSLGFVEHARRSTWSSGPASGLGLPPPDIRIVPRLASHWPEQRRWLEECYPLRLAWHLPLNPHTLQPGFVGGLFRLFNTTQVFQWSAERAGKLQGVIAWQTTPSYADHLWLAVASESRDETVRALLLHARQRLPAHRPLALDFPAGRAVAAIQSTGFQLHQTLIWMSVTFS